MRITGARFVFLLECNYFALICLAINSDTSTKTCFCKASNDIFVSRIFFLIYLKVNSLLYLPTYISKKVVLMGNI